MFARPNRLQKGQDILAVLRRGTRASCGLVCCSFLKKPGSLKKATVIVSTKVSKKSTVRNLCKRRARAVIKELGWPEGDLVIQLRPGAAELAFPELKNQIEQCLKRLH